MKATEYWMYFLLSELRKRGKRFAEARRRNHGVLPKIRRMKT